MGKLQKLDNRIQVMLQNGVNQNYRSLLAFVGNKGQDQVPILHQIQTAITKKGLLKILWCYKKELSFSTHRKRNLKLLNKRRKSGILSDGTVFEQFICSTDIRWCYYHETDKILGQTFHMCILQDFEALTPNTLARTIETVAGGGVIVFLLKSMDSLRQLCTMAMDVHARYRTEANADVVCRFNERFLLSLAQNPRCIVLDDRWNILPISKKVINSLDSLHDRAQLEYISKEQTELAKLKLLLTEDGSYFASLVNLCKTLDQAKSLLQFCAALLDITNPFEKSKIKSASPSNKLAQFDLTTQDLITHLSDNNKQAGQKASSAVVVMTAGRGRGKSAALGLGLAAAFDAGLPNMCVTAPSPENLLTLMQFVLLGLKALKYEEHVDYIVYRSTDPEHSKAVVKVEVTRRLYRQSLVYLQPWEAAAGAGGGWQPDLFCIDEAAAIPLPKVRQMITGPKLVFMASTINGYEGTGRSLSVKLIQQLRNECQRVDPTVSVTATAAVGDRPRDFGKSLQLMNRSRLLYEISLKEAIRYANGDSVEAWLNNLLCLDCGDSLSMSAAGDGVGGIAPAPDLCQLYYVNRDTLFAYHASTEVFLQRLMALYVSSHYKNSPNDLQLLSDAPAHHIFCLLAPYNPKSGRVPEILCVLQVCLEGKINREVVLRGLARGLRPSGDLIPWTISQQFCEPNFGELSGARVIRIATHPDYQGLGYGSRALSLLHKYYLGEIPVTVPTTVTPHSESVQHPAAIDATGNESAVEEDAEKPDDEEDDAEDIPEDLSDVEMVEPVTKKAKHQAESESSSSRLLTETLERRSSADLPPLLSRLGERKPEKLNYIGVSFGATPKLIKFWKKAGYLPVYLRQTMNDLTGEFSCIMLSELRHGGETNVDSDWLKQFYLDFCGRFLKLLPGPFKTLDAVYALELLSTKATRNWTGEELSSAEVQRHFSDLELERLHRYLRSLLDFQMVAHQLPELAQLYFLRRFPAVKINKTQQVILCGLGVQRKPVDQLAAELEHLLGADGGLQNSKQRLDAKAANGSWTAGTGGHARQQAAAKLKRDGEATVEQTASLSSGWARRIRGLLFVIMRELVKSLDASLKTTWESAEPQLKSLLHRGELNPRLPDLPLESRTGGEIRDPEDDGDNEDDDLGDEFIPTDRTSDSLSSATTAPAATDTTEQSRRAQIVKELLCEEGDIQLARYAVKGSEKSWGVAVAGHGSELTSLHVRLPTEESANHDSQVGGKKRNREALGDKIERKRHLRMGQSVNDLGVKHKGGKKHHKK